MNKLLKENFLNLKVTGQRAAIPSAEKEHKDAQLVHYLQSIIKDSVVTSFEDVGFCYWNISDSYALLKNSSSLFANHKRFYKHVLSANGEYLYWTVNDATQRLALENGGFAEFWWALYQEAVLLNQNVSHPFVEFTAHRAALYSNPLLPPHRRKHITLATAAFERFLDRTKDTDEFPFYEVVYLSLVSRFEGLNNNKLKDLSTNLFEGLSAPNYPNHQHLPGEWKSMVTPPNKRKQSIVGINSAVNAFIDSQELSTAKDLYYSATALGMPKNHYIENRL